MLFTYAASTLPTNGKSDSPTGGVVRRLRLDVGLTEEDLADVTGASQRTVRRWLANDVDEPRRIHAARIDDLRTVVDALDDTLTPRGIRQWLHARNRYLKGARPIKRLSQGDFEEVYKAALAFAEGDYL